MDGIGSMPCMMYGGESPVSYHPSPEKKYRKIPSRQTAFVGLAKFFVVACLVGCGSAGITSSTPVSSPTGTRLAAGAPGQVARCHLRLLVFSKTGVFRHASIPAAIAVLRMLAESQGVAVDFTEDSSAFTEANLSGYNAVVFLLTTGEILDTREQTAFEHYI